MQSHGVTSDLIQESRALFVFHYGSVWYEHIQLGFFGVCLGVFVPLEDCLLIWRSHHCRWRAANFDLWAIEQWGFFSVSHLLWQGAFIYNDHLRGPVTLTPIAGCLARELSLPDFTTKVCRIWDSNTHPSACDSSCPAAVIQLVIMTELIKYCYRLTILSQKYTTINFWL